MCMCVGYLDLLVCWDVVSTSIGLCFLGGGRVALGCDSIKEHERAGEGGLS